MRRLHRRTVSALLALAFVAAPAGFGVSGAFAAADDTELAKQMEVIETGMKKLRRSLKKADANAESLAQIALMQQAAVAAKALVPAYAARVPEAEREKFLAGYRKDMATFVSEICQMEIAVLEGNNDKAQEVYKRLDEMEDSGHEKYAPDAESSGESAEK